MVIELFNKFLDKRSKLKKTNVSSYHICQLEFGIYEVFCAAIYQICCLDVSLFNNI